MKSKVIIVDDDVVLCELGQEMFEILDVEALTAQTLVAAIECFKANHQDIGLAIFDLNLEECTGIDVFEAMKEISTDFAAVMASGIFIDEDAPKYIDMGFKEIIMKPYNMGTLKELITKYLSS